MSKQNDGGAEKLKQLHNAITSAKAIALSPQMDNSHIRKAVRTVLAVCDADTMQALRTGAAMLAERERSNGQEAG